MMKLLGNRVLVKREPKAETTGFAEVKAIDDFTCRGIVHGVGDEVELAVSPGDIVLFAKFSPDTFTVDFDGEDMKSVLVSDIIAIDDHA